MSTDDGEALARQLRAMNLAWELAKAGDQSAGDPAILELQIRELRARAWRKKLARQVAARIAVDPAAEPLAQQVAQAIIGVIEKPEPVEVSASSAQVLIGGDGAQLGDVHTGDIAGGNIIKDNCFVVNIYVQRD